VPMALSHEPTLCGSWPNRKTVLSGPDRPVRLAAVSWTRREWGAVLLRDMRSCKK